MAEEPDVHVGAMETAGGGELTELSGDAAEQLYAFVFGGVADRSLTKGGGAVQAERQVISWLAGEGVQERNGAEIRVTQQGVQGHGSFIGHMPEVFQEEK